PPPSTDEEFERIERARARRARRRGEIEPEPTPPARDRRQLELFTPTGRPTRAALGLATQPQARAARRGEEPAAFQQRPVEEPTPETTPEPAPEPTPARQPGAMPGSTRF